jgi:hypothetical protein
MDPLVLVLRFVHVVFGALWVGMMTFGTFFLMPAVQEVGPDGGKVMAAIQRRGLMTFMPILAIGTLISGIWLYLRASAGMAAEFGRSPTGMAFGLGGLAALVAFILGVAVLRPMMMKAMALGQTAAAAPTPADRERVMGEAARLRVRSANVSRLTAYLLFFAVTAMAVARYL